MLRQRIGELESPITNFVREKLVHSLDNCIGEYKMLGYRKNMVKDTKVFQSIDRCIITRTLLLISLLARLIYGCLLIHVTDPT
ncbi:transmembrane protein, putative [Medicago truncatula]|uniref:Transmembrane protein, putative n=1 Tax=Medicago truncatula TaxID=3880 RepID=G7K1X9_MEDTR|nr:transmembrane protein, putative [Medicago truncatula]